MTGDTKTDAAPARAGSVGEAAQLLALIRAHGERDDEQFYAVALQIAAAAARKGHVRVASDLKSMVARARGRPKPAEADAVVAELKGLVRAVPPRGGLDRLVLAEEVVRPLRKALRQHRPEARTLLAASGLAPESRFLLIGPSGTGKTSTASAFAVEIGLPCYSIALDSLITKYMGETGAKLGLVFETMRKRRGVYFFDEFDAIAAPRDMEHDIGEARRILNVLLMRLEDDIGSSVVFAASNLKRLLDRAIFRRFDRRIEYPMPSPGMVAPIVRTSLPEGFAGTLARIDWDRIAEAAAGLSHADIERGALDAARIAVLDAGGDITTELMAEALRERAREEYGRRGD